MRFIFNFIFFGVLFYAIYLAFPDAFFTMVGWATKIYEFVKDLVIQVYEKIQGITAKSGGASSNSHQNALFLLPLWLMMTFKLRS